MTLSTCPHCGAEMDYENPARVEFKCNSAKYRDGLFVRDFDCYKRELAAKDAEIKRMRNALDKINAMLPQHDSDGNLFQIYYDSESHAQFEPVNVGVLVTQIAALITEEKGEVK